MVKLKKINVISLAKLHGVVMVFIGLIAGILYSFGGLIIDVFVSAGWVTSASTPGLSYGTALAFFALIGMPFLFGVFGLVTGAVVAILYNIISKMFKGIELEFGES